MFIESGAIDTNGMQLFKMGHAFLNVWVCWVYEKHSKSAILAYDLVNFVYFLMLFFIDFVGI